MSGPPPPAGQSTRYALSFRDDATQPTGWLACRAPNFPSGSMTIATWLKWVAPAVGNPESASFATSAETATLFTFGADPENVDVSTELRVSGLNTLAVFWGGSEVRFPAHLGDGQWHHLAITIDVSTEIRVRALVDGTEVGTANLRKDASDGPPARDTLVLGQRLMSDANDRFCGLLADFAVWDGVRADDALAKDRARGPGDSPRVAVIPDATLPAGWMHEGAVATAKLYADPFGGGGT